MARIHVILRPNEWLNGTITMECVLLFSPPVIHVLLTASLIHHILPWCQSSAENAHMPSVFHSFQGQVCVCVCGSVPAAVRQSGAGGPPGVAARPFTPTLPFPSIPSLCPATWSSHIYHSQLKWQKAAGKCRGRRAISHVAQPLMQICLLMKAFWATRMCLMVILHMSAAVWPQGPVALSMSWILCVIFMT